MPGRFDRPARQLKGYRRCVLNELEVGRGGKRERSTRRGKKRKNCRVVCRARASSSFALVTVLTCVVNVPTCARLNSFVAASLNPFSLNLGLRKLRRIMGKMYS
jgi:hypothetical protein